MVREEHISTDENNLKTLFARAFLLQLDTADGVLEDVLQDLIPSRQEPLHSSTRRLKCMDSLSTFLRDCLRGCRARGEFREQIYRDSGQLPEHIIVRHVPP